jgi:hypothetical protein
MDPSGQAAHEAVVTGATAGLMGSLSARLSHATLDVARSYPGEGLASEIAYREAIAALAEHLKEGGAPPERVVIAVKRVISGAIRTVWPRPEPRDRRRMVDEGVRCCVAAYYGRRAD